MANQSVPNQQITTYTHNGFRTDVNKVKMPFGTGVPLQPIYNLFLNPLVDLVPSSIASGSSGQLILTLNRNPSETLPALPPALTGIQLFTFSKQIGNLLLKGSALNLGSYVSYGVFSPTKISITMAGFVGTSTPSIIFTVTGTVGGVPNTTDIITVDSKSAASTKKFFTQVSSIIVTDVIGTITSSVISAGTTIIPVLNVAAVSILNPASQSGLTSASFIPLSSAAKGTFPAQKLTLYVTATSASGTIGQTTITFNGINDSTGAEEVPITLVKDIPTAFSTTALFTSLTSIVIKVTGTNVTSLAITGSLFAYNVPVTPALYKTIKGTQMIQLDSQRCLAFTTGGTSPTTTASTILITGYDDRFVQVQERLILQEGTTTGTIITSNKAYSYIQSIALSVDPGGATALAVSASNQFFGLPFYLIIGTNPTAAISSVGVDNLLVGPPSVSPLDSCNGNNFYSVIPNADAVVSQNLSKGTEIQVSTRDARGVFGFSIPLLSSSTFITASVYIYAADSFVNAQLQDSSNPIAQQQTSNSITGTVGATINNSLTWTNTPGQMTWATTQLSDFDLTGAQFPGDQAQFNQIFNSSNLPPSARRSMGSAETKP